MLIFTFFASQNNLVKINLIHIKVSGTNVHVCAVHTFLHYYLASLLQQRMDQCSSQLSSSLCRITVTDSGSLEINHYRCGIHLPYKQQLHAMLTIKCTSVNYDHLCAGTLNKHPHVNLANIILMPFTRFNATNNTTVEITNSWYIEGIHESCNPRK